MMAVHDIAVPDIAAPDGTVADSMATVRPPSGVIALTADMSYQQRAALAARDLREGLAMLRLATILAWLDIKIRYRGSLLGPFWLTLSMAVMVGAIGFNNSVIFKADIANYLPFLSLSLTLWGYLGTMCGEAGTCFTQAEGVLRSVRLPFTLQACRCVIRNLMVLGHNIIVPIGVFLLLGIPITPLAVLALPALALWLAVSLALCLSLGAVCARFRDVPPIITSILQVAFFVSGIMWKTSDLGGEQLWMQFNPFYTLIEIVRGPMLGTVPSTGDYLSALLWGAVICTSSWLMFVRARGRITFWV